MNHLRACLHAHAFDYRFVPVLIVLLCLLGCGRGRDTEVFIKSGTPPKFILSGRSTLDYLRITGPDTEREPNQQAHKGDYLPLTKVYWQIAPTALASDRKINDLGPITYGNVPEGFIQVYPEHGVPPPLIEENSYNLTLSAKNAHGVNMFFIIRNGQIVAEGQ